MGLTATGFAIVSFNISAPVFSTIGFGSYAFDMGVLDCRFMIGFNPRGGVGGTPATPQQVTIGIVQNVVFERMVLTYGSTEFSVDFPGAALDTIANFYTPFYADPDLGSGMAQSSEDIWLTANGYDRIIDPFDPTGKGASNTPGLLELADQPSLGLRLRLDDGSMLTSAERIIALQQWVIVQQNGRNLTIASAGPFSMVYWMNVQSMGSTLGLPSFHYAGFGADGIFKRKDLAKDEFQATSNASTKFQLGNGGRNPVFGGQTANDRGLDWVTRNGLVAKNPFSPSSSSNP
jgi:hypothetical protein